MKRKEGEGELPSEHTDLHADDAFDKFNDDHNHNTADDPMEKLKSNVVEINRMKNYHQSLYFN